MEGRIAAALLLKRRFPEGHPARRYYRRVKCHVPIDLKAEPFTHANAGPFTLTRDATHLHLDFTIDSTLTVGVDGFYLELSDGGGAPFRLTGWDDSQM